MSAVALRPSTGPRPRRPPRPFLVDEVERQASRASALLVEPNEQGAIALPVPSLGAEPPACLVAFVIRVRSVGIAADALPASQQRLVADIDARIGLEHRRLRIRWH